MKSLKTFVVLLLSTLSQLSSAETVKDWTFLVYLNGFNNLDSFGYKDINEMEVVGSTSQVNVVVQWASLKTKQVKRVYIQKDTDINQSHSPVLENLGQIDMGDYKSLIQFVKWAKDKYPAKKYFINVWNHGAGWHLTELRNEPTRDISSDDLSGNKITTEQLAFAVKESAKIIGQKVDIFGSDACLMGMIEVAAQMKNDVDVYAGSQEVEPGDGWPYDRLLKQWNASSRLGNASPEQVAKILTKEYIDSYGEGRAVTFSAYKMLFYPELSSKIKEIKNSILSQSGAQMQVTKKMADETIGFAYEDYKDLGQFISKLNSQRLLDQRSLENFNKALQSFVVANKGSGEYKDVTGVSIWLPVVKWTYDTYQDRYSKLVFNQDNAWLEALNRVVQ